MTEIQLVLCEEFGSYNLALAWFNRQQYYACFLDNFIAPEAGPEGGPIFSTLIDIPPKEIKRAFVGSSIVGEQEKAALNELRDLKVPITIIVDAIWNIPARIKELEGVLGEYPVRLLVPDTAVLGRVLSLKNIMNVVGYDVYENGVITEYEVVDPTSDKSKIIIIGEYFFPPIDGIDKLEQGSNTDFEIIIEAIERILDEKPWVEVLYKAHPSGMAEKALKYFQPMSQADWDAMIRSECVFLGVDSRLLLDLGRAGFSAISCRHTFQDVATLSDFYPYVQVAHTALELFEKLKSELK